MVYKEKYAGSFETTRGNTVGKDRTKHFSMVTSHLTLYYTFIRNSLRVIFMHYVFAFMCDVGFLHILSAYCEVIYQYKVSFSSLLIGSGNIGFFLSSFFLF